MSEVLTTMGISIAYFFVGLILANFFTKELFFQIVMCKITGKKLVSVRGIRTRYYVPATLKGNELSLRDKKNKKTLRIENVEEGHFYRAFGLDVLDVTENGNIITQKGDPIPSIDPELAEDLAIRSLYKPSKNDAKYQLLLYAIIGVGAIAAMTLYLVMQLSGGKII